MINSRYRVLEWDSQWFGIPIGRADLTQVTVSSILEVDTWAEKLGLKCLYIFVEDGSQAQENIDGLMPIDTRVEYELDPVVLAKGLMDMEHLMQPTEQSSVCSLARRLFTKTRFARDPGFPLPRVRELYAEWVRQDSEGGLPGCLVIRSGEEILGFITGRIDPIDPTRGKIGLFGVNKSHQGCGFGSKLLDYACRAFLKVGVKSVTVVTQEANVAGNRLYERGGRVIARGLWYHRWYQGNMP